MFGLLVMLSRMEKRAHIILAMSRVFSMCVVSARTRDTCGEMRPFDKHAEFTRVFWHSPLSARLFSDVAHDRVSREAAAMRKGELSLTKTKMIVNEF